MDQFSHPSNHGYAPGVIIFIVFCGKIPKKEVIDELVPYNHI